MGSIRLRFHGMHAPQRQVFMAATFDYLAKPGTPISILEIGAASGASLWIWVNTFVKFGAGPTSILCIDAWRLGVPEPKAADARGVLPPFCPPDLMEKIQSYFASPNEIAALI